MSRFNNIKNRLRGVASLVQSDEAPDPEAYSRASTEIKSVNSDVSWPEDEIADYWRLYETNPLISQPINRTATEVFEPGYYVTAASEKTAEELQEYLENVGIEGGMPRRDFTTVGKQAVIQYEVRGTFMAEKVTDSQGRHNAINPVQSDTFEIHTKPQSNILLAPEDYREFNGVKRDEEGNAAAFVQFDVEDSRWSDRKERRFSRDQMLHWPRSPDIGDVRGTSRLETVYERARALEAKFRDNDDAIAMKAWPMILFQLGKEDRPWTMDEMEDFMEPYDEGNLGPGMYHGVPGDVDIKEFAGETADIKEHVEKDVDFVISGMPGPKYALGSFAGNISTTVASAQERQYRKLIRRLRREIEDLFTPYLVEVAESWDLDTEDIQLHIGRPSGEVSPDDVSGSIIRYTSDVDGEGEEQGRRDPDADPDDETADDDDKPSGPLTDDSGGSSNSTEEASTLIPEDVAEAIGDEGVAELADPRLVSTADSGSAVSSAVTEALIQARDGAIRELRSQARQGSDSTPGQVADALTSGFGQSLVDVGFEQTVDDSLADVGTDTVATLGQDSHSPSMDLTYSSRHRDIVEEQRRSLRQDMEKMARDASADVRRIVTSASQDDVGRIGDRIREAIDQGSIRRRAELIARMHSQRIVNKIKLNEYQRDSRIAGVGVTNPCVGDTTTLCEDLAGCGTHEQATAMFDDPKTIGEQFEAQMSASIPSGFAPLTATPPFHYGCRSELIPVLDE